LVVNLVTRRLAQIVCHYEIDCDRGADRNPIN